MKMAIAQYDRQLFASLKRAEETADLYRIWVDGSVLHVDAGGYWTLQVAEAYVRDITRIISQLRNVKPHLRAIVDRSASPIFERAAGEILVSTYSSILQNGDRIAIIVDCSLVKGHIRSLAGREETQIFLSMSAAKTWLLAYG